MTSKQKNRAEFSKRLNQALDKAGVPPKGKGRQTAVAEMFGVSQKGARKWLEGESIPQMTRIQQIGAALGVNMEWLLSGNGPAENLTVELPTAHEVNEAQPFYTSGTVPLISWTQAGQWSELVDNLHPGDAERMVPTSKPMGPNAFALRIRGDSMEPTIPDGAIVVVDPDTPAEHRKIVIVKQNDHGEATCKRLVYEGERPYLKPDNPSYPVLEMQPDAQVCGVVRQIIIETD